MFALFALVPAGGILAVSLALGRTGEARFRREHRLRTVWYLSAVLQKAHVKHLTLTTKATCFEPNVAKPLTTSILIVACMFVLFGLVSAGGIRAVSLAPNRPADAPRARSLRNLAFEHSPAESARKVRIADNEATNFRNKCIKNLTT